MPALLADVAATDRAGTDVAEDEVATVYLIHFDRPYISPGGKRPQHYLGATTLDLDERMNRHRTERGAALLRAALQSGIQLEVVRTWKVKSRRAAFQLEIELKRRRRHSHWCPICSGARKP